ncbi:SDR family NAD(P)-dependent oxidoreductase [Rhodococcus sp. H36-A4]|uniref:SDR family NAD(P)-dependent oxidoreductase n=1 Tax=unclassified Rhodococcus (in: high G+C Gram-positive bacteria) TaxID=192944 RepID=UPI0022B062B6|nr:MULTISPECIES: SDR family NAD(P)-dependent oxidoreductase [unclassified Rhodococcus (in: high G+C Gram-positive bacteria)]MCZ4077273.1 SDR family NAD(P)-dependent oxidoreductase [Rhodococcus sp. H36-A4]MDJ0359662.1 SDR family NAD(P)-dependent oxidoreductase [Rhodococcus sp. H29-C3]
MSKSTVVIVGAGSGVSASIARKFGNKGFTVILLARNAESLQLQVSKLQKENIEAHGIAADASVSDTLISAFGRITSEFGTPDVLVYNAGSNTISEPSTLEQKALLSDFTVNVMGGLTSAQQVIPGMIERKSGTILFTGGMLALNPVPSRASASIGKAGLRNLSFTLAEELAPHGITVGIVTIGGVVQPGTFFDPDLIAESYWELFTNGHPKEILYTQT